MMKRYTAYVFSVFFLAGCGEKEQVIQIQHGETGSVLEEFPAETNDEVALSWVHSVEQTPWTDVFTITENCRLLLTETRFQSFGAGVEHQYEDISHEDGTYTARGLNECHDSVNWIHSHDAEHTVTINRVEEVDTASLPHHEPLRITIEER
jgi:hypothetical protein